MNLKICLSCMDNYINDLSSCPSKPLKLYIGGLVQERRNSIANGLELHLSYTNPLICRMMFPKYKLICKHNLYSSGRLNSLSYLPQIARFMGPTWGPPGSCRPQMDPMLAPLALLSRYIFLQTFDRDP